MSSTRWRRVAPIGTSTMPVCRTSPASEKTLVPWLPYVPRRAKSAAPWAAIQETLANVSTLLMQVGWPFKPLVTGYGGRRLGSPRRPSSEAISAVSSPHTKAPAPRRIAMSKDQSVPSRFQPRLPAARAWSTASSSRRTASGYSSRT